MPPLPLFAHRSQISHRQHDDQTTQAYCHTLVTNPCVFWTTIYLEHASAAHRNEGHPFTDAAIAHLSPARFEHINPYGTYTFNVKAILGRQHHRPLKPLSALDEV